MARLIDADKLKEHYSWWANSTNYDLCEMKKVVDDIVDVQPTVNAEPVVRCKDCRWHENEQPSMVYCPAVVGGWVDNDWFCKGGERKDDEIN